MSSELTDSVTIDEQPGMLAGVLGSRYRLTLAVCAAAYVAMLLWSYRTFIAPNYAYMGLYFAPPSLGALLLGVAAALLPALWMDVLPDRPSTIAYFLLYALLYVPACIVPFCVLDHNAVNYTRFLACLVGCFWMLQKIRGSRLVIVSRFRFHELQFSIVLTAITLLATGLIISQLGLRFHAPSLSSKVNSELRSEFGDAVRQGPMWLAYVMPWLAKVLAPGAIVCGLTCRRPWLLGAGAFAQIVIFMQTGHKTILLSPVLLLGLYFVMRLSRQKTYALLLCCLTLVVGFAAISDHYFGDGRTPYASSLFVRRSILVPGQLSGYYFDFFSENPKALLGHSILSDFVKYPYEDPPPRIIMKTYLGFDGNANAGVWSDGFANFGFVGMILSTVILGFAMWLYDSAAQGAEARVSTLLMVMPAMALVNSAVLTVLLTHGFFLAILLVSIMPHDAGQQAEAL